MAIKKNEEHIELKATKGGLSFLRWLIPFLLTGSILGTGGRVVANDLNSLDDRVSKLEETISANSIELNGQKIRLNEYEAKLVEMKTDIRETREDTKQILIILTKKN